MFYPGGLNAAACCRKKLCTECYLQVRSAPGSDKLNATCPFCNKPGLGVSFSGAMSEEELESRIGVWPETTSRAR